MPTYRDSVGLPDIYRRALEASVASHSREGAERSVTELIAPPRISTLAARHPEIELELSDQMFSMWGTALHEYLEVHGGNRQERVVAAWRRFVEAISEHYGDTDWRSLVDQLEATFKLHDVTMQSDATRQQEHRLHAVWYGMPVSGAIDVIDGREIWDHKFVGVRTFTDGPKQEYEAQLNLYRRLCRDNGIFIDDLWLVASYRDWRYSDARRERKYPQLPLERHKVECWAEGVVDEFIATRVALHQQASLLPDERLPRCSKEEQWRQEEHWAAIKDGNRRATKRFDDEQSAVDYARANGLNVSHRAGIAVRCERFCPVASVCLQRKEETEGQE